MTNWKEEVAKIQPCPQRQDSTAEQMIDLYAIATKLGFYDAGDYIKKNFVDNPKLKELTPPKKEPAKIKLVKSDWTLVREAESEGLMVAMTSTVQPKRTPLNNELSHYFRSQLPRYSGMFSKEEGEEILYGINEYMEQNGMNKHPLDYPMTSGTEIHLIPISENMELKMVVVDEYYGDGESTQYVDVTFFKINGNTTKQDVDRLIVFAKEYLMK